jgi:DNA protecting protein DprA
MNHETIILQLMRTEGVGARTLARLLGVLSSEQLELEDLFSADSAELLQRCKLPGDFAARVGMDFEEAEQLRQELEGQSIRMGEASPPVLFVHGDVNLLSQPAVAICGSRRVSQQGSNTTSDLAAQLAQQGINIVSGYAAGVDQAAHGSAIEAGGATTLVLPTGVMRFNMTDILDAAATDDRLLVISEFYPMSPWSTWNAMQRNSTVVGLSDVVVAVEPAMSGGTFDAARTALKFGCPLFLALSGEFDDSNDARRYFLRRGAVALSWDGDNRASLNQVIEAIHRRHESGGPSGRPP